MPKEKYRPTLKRVWEKNPKQFQLELESDENLSFNEIAVCAITNLADLEFEPQCHKALKKLQRKSPLAQKKDIEALEKEVDWGGLYNQKVLDILDEYKIESYMDKYGALGWIDPEGNSHFGDDVGYYPWYANEKILREHLLKEFEREFEEEGEEIEEEELEVKEKEEEEK